MKNYYHITIIIVIFLGLGGCNTPQNPFEAANFNPLDETDKHIASYFAKDTENQQLTDSAMVFIDFSDGMLSAYTGNPENSKILEAITHKLIAPNITWYGLGGGNIYPLDFPSTQLYNRVTDSKSYSKEIMAPIENTLSKIVDGHSEALFVTDFEEYTTDKKEQFENFGKEYFKKWLDKGNAVDFFMTNYSEKTKDGRIITKHLYFTIFSTSTNTLLNDIKYALKDRGFNYT